MVQKPCPEATPEPLAVHVHTHHYFRSFFTDANPLRSEYRRPPDTVSWLHWKLARCDTEVPAFPAMASPNKEGRNPGFHFSRSINPPSEILNIFFSFYEEHEATVSTCCRCSQRQRRRLTELDRKMSRCSWLILQVTLPCPRTYDLQGKLDIHDTAKQ